ncbi:MAG TPA: SigB/SigF/SigG family RNA polymerase sigma factor [Conexibacter sp.]|nr:SigB/SigF/SigG family RNA polymerase sigma factor [Conexibacter sp.]
MSHAPAPLDPAALASVEELLDRYARTGDQRARELAFEQAMPLARRLAWRYRRGQEQIDDLLQVAYVGLVAAIDRFDPSRGTRFASFAGPTIAGELRRHFRNTSWTAHVPRGVQEHFLLVRRASDDLTTRLGRSPRVSELARATGLDAEQITEALHAHVALQATSLDTPLGDEEDGIALADVLGADDDRFDGIDRSAAVASLLQSLPRSDRELLRMRFVEDMTQSEIAARLGCSQMQVSRLLRRLLARLASADDPASAHHHALS